MVSTIGKSFAVAGDFFSFSLFVCFLFSILILILISYCCYFLSSFFFRGSGNDFFIFVPF